MKREKRVYLYVSDEERKRLEEAAESAGLSLSSWIRVLVLKEADEVMNRKRSKS